MRSFIFILLTLFTSSAQAITIKGQILPNPNGAIMPSKVYVKSFTLSNNYVLDSFGVNDFGAYTIKMPITQTALFYLYVGNTRYKILLSPTEKEFRFSNELNNKDKFTLEGSRENDAYRKFREAAQFYEDDIFMLLKMNLPEDSINKEVKLQVKNLGENIKAIRYYYPETYASKVLCRFKSYSLATTLVGEKDMRQFLKTHFLDSLTYDDAQLLEEPTFDDAFMGYVANLLDTGDRAVSDFATSYETNPKIALPIYKYIHRQLFQYLILSQQENALRSFIDKVLADERSKENLVLIEQMNMVKAILPGEKYKEVSGKDMKGDSLSLSNFIAKNKLNLLIFWEPSCSHCKESMPLISTLYERYAKKGLGIFGVSNTEEEEWQKFLTTEKLPWTNILAQSSKTEKSAASDYFVMYTPSFVLIKQDGTIFRRFIGIRDLETEIKKQL